MLDKLFDIPGTLLDKEKTWAYRLLWVLTAFGILLMADFCTGFTQNLHTSHKLEYLEKIQDLKSDFQSDSTVLKELEKTKSRVLEGKHYTEHFRDAVSSIEFPSFGDDGKLSTGPYEDALDKIDRRSAFWMLISSNYSIVLIFPIMLFFPIFSSEFRGGEKLLGWFASLVLMAIWCAVTTGISFQIPFIGQKPTWNYLLNFAIHTFFIFVVYRAQKKK